MKRIGLIGVCFGMILLLTGCGNEVELTCTMEESASYATTVMQYHLTYRDEELVTMDEGVVMEINESYSYIDSLLSNFEEDFNETVDEYVSEFGRDTIEADISVDGNRLTASMSYNISQMNEEQLEYTSYQDEYSTYESAKESLEAEGFVCE